MTTDITTWTDDALDEEIFEYRQKAIEYYLDDEIDPEVRDWLNKLESERARRLSHTSVFNWEMKHFNAKLHNAVAECGFNGQGRRQLIDKFIDEWVL